jgi:mannose-6-phosphate isomerase
VQPIVLPPNQPTRFYRGGEAIAAFRGLPSTSGHVPEDWVGSTTSTFGTDIGLTVLPDGTLLRDAVAADPESYLGADHLAAYGADTALLVKLLDAGERLPVHLHPPRSFAELHLGCRYGKTEAWLILGTTGPSPEVYLGFREDLSAEDLDVLVAAQKSDDLIAALNPVPVAVGDAVLVPAGTPHAVGAGVFLLELQEPTDFSIMLEYARYGIDGETGGSLDLGLKTALTCTDRSGWGPDRIAAARGAGWTSDGSVRKATMPAAADSFFRAERLQPPPGGSVELEPSFAIVVGVEGAGTYQTANGGSLAIRRGHTVLVPYGSGVSTVSGDVTLIRCLPPAPTPSGR